MDVPPPVPAPTPVPAVVTKTTSGAAIVSLVAGVVAICGGLTSIVAIIFGHVALSRIRRQPTLAGRGLAIAGLVLGYSLLCIWIVVFGISAIREMSRAAQPHGQVLNIDGEHDTRVIDGDLDYGVTVTVIIKNNSQKGGAIKITPWLTCSEGEWNRSQELVFNAEEIKRVTYFFQEPTINATNLQYGANVDPE